MTLSSSTIQGGRSQVLPISNNKYILGLFSSAQEKYRMQSDLTGEAASHAGRGLSGLG